MQGFNGVTPSHIQWFAVGSSCYVGVIAVVLALTGVILRRRPEVVGLAAVGVVLGAIVFLPPVADLVGHLPFRARWHLALVVAVFAVSALAGVGTDALVAAPRDYATRMCLGSGFGVSALVLAALWVLGRGHLAPAAARVRNQSFVWPVVCVVVGAVVVVALNGRRRRPGETPGGSARRVGVGQRAALVLVAVEIAFLVGVGSSTLSSSSSPFEDAAPVQALQKAVGSALVGFGSPSCELPPSLGLLPEANAAYGVRELSAYDPLTPQEDFHALHAPVEIPAAALCPVMRSAAEARLYGVQFVLTARGAPRPQGMLFDKVIGGETLYVVPGAAPATLTPLLASGATPGPSAPGTPVAVHDPDPGSWQMVTRARAAGVLRLRVSDMPGWHATIDGRPLALRRFSHIMLEATIPAGVHTVALHYWPDRFTEGIVLAVVAVVVLLALGAVWLVRRRRPRVS